MAGNQNLPARVYSQQFLQLLPTVFAAQAHFTGTFGALQALDGVSNNKKAFTVKTNDMPVVVGEYSEDENVAFGTGTANSTRFGQRKEVIYTDTDVPYQKTWAFHEGIDRFTVNNDLNAAVADRLNLQAQAKVRMFNKLMGQTLADASTDLGELDDVNAAFEKAVEEYTDMEMVAPARAYVTAEVYNAIIDHQLVTTGKGSAVNIDTNGIVRFRDIIVEKTPKADMGGKAIIFAPDNIARVFTGINTTRTIESEDFDGVALQGAGRYGTFILEDNKKAILSYSPKA